MTGDVVTEPLFKTGDQVRIHDSNPPGHRRTPDYIKGKIGIIERYCGRFVNPEESAYGFDGLPLRHLYRVRFDQAHIWKDYDGGAGDTLDIEMYEHWLRPAGGSAPKQKKAIFQ